MNINSPNPSLTNITDQSPILMDYALLAFVKIIQLDVAGHLTINDLEPAAMIMQNYIPNTIMQPYEDSDPINGS